MIDPAEMEMIRSAVALLSAVGKEPSIRRVSALIELAHGRRGLRWSTIAAALKVLPGNTVGNTPATVGQRIDEASATPRQQAETATCASADLSRVLEDSADNEDSIPHLLPTVVDASPPQTEFFPVLSAVPDLVKPKAAKAERITIASQALDSDFGEFEADVSAILGVEAGFRADRKISVNLRDQMRRQLAFWRRKHGDEAFARGLEVGISSGKGVAYAGGVIRKFDPGRDASLPAHRGGLQALPDRVDPPTVSELIEIEKANGTYVPTEILPWERPPWDPRYRREPREQIAL